MNKLSLTEHLAYGLLKLAQYTPFRGNGNSFVTGCENTDGKPDTDEFRQAKIEAAHFLEIFPYFKMHSPQFSGKTILDLGSGYTLNGIGGEEFLSIARSNGFEVVYHRYTPLAERFLPWCKYVVWVNELIMRINPRAREGFSFNLVCVLRKNRAIGWPS